MKFIVIIFFFISQVSISQITEINKLLIEGEKAYLEKNFILAKHIYLKVTDLDPKNKDAWYNLAASELNLNESEIACEHFYKVYLLDDSKILDDLKRYCPNFRNGKIMSINDVEEPPKFTYDLKEYNLFENNLLNPLYLKILIKELKKSKLLRNKLKGKLVIQIRVNSFNIFDGKIIRIGANEEDVEMVEMEVMNIFKNIVTYKSAKNKGVNVDLWEKPTLPLDFGN